MAINGQAPGVLAEEACRTGALLIHYSTDYVFDGSKNRSHGSKMTPRIRSAFMVRPSSQEKMQSAPSAAAT